MARGGNAYYDDNHLNPTTNAAVARIKSDWAGDVRAYDAVHEQILKMANMLAMGIANQFPDKVSLVAARDLQLAVEPFVHNRVHNEEVTMASPASVAGHPIHPMIIPFPIALWVFSLVADVIYLWRGNPVWRNTVAFYTLLAGILGAVVAAVFGIIDWLSITNPTVKKVANWHARLNVIALIVFAASFYLRTASGSQWVNGSYTIPLALSVFGVILITISGYLGGELVFRYGVAVNPQRDGEIEAGIKARTA